MNSIPSIDYLLNQAADAPDLVLSQLQAHPGLAAQQDGHGYSLLHAAVSWEHVDLLKALIRDFHVSPYLVDEDGETCLFNAESVDIAREAIALGVKLDHRNHSNQTAAEKLADEDEQPLVAAYLRELDGHSTAEGAASIIAQTGGANASSSAQAGTLPGVEGGAAQRPPPLPNGVEINVGTMQQVDVGEEPDPEFRRRIEELAARQDFEGDEAQRELRNLISDAVSGVTQDGQGSASRRRLG